jgi:hypothetical protein
MISGLSKVLEQAAQFGSTTDLESLLLEAGSKQFKYFLPPLELMSKRVFERERRETPGTRLFSYQQIGGNLMRMEGPNAGKMLGTAAKVPGCVLTNHFRVQLLAAGHQSGECFSGD